jgi:hypothetical protein
VAGFLPSPILQILSNTKVVPVESWIHELQNDVQLCWVPSDRNRGM